MHFAFLEFPFKPPKKSAGRIQSLSLFNKKRDESQLKPEGFHYPQSTTRRKHRDVLVFAYG